MKLVVDGNTRDIEGRSLGQATQSEIDAILQASRYIQSVHVNGEERELQSFLASIEDIRETDEIALVSCTLDDLIESTMASVHNYTPILLHGLQHAGDSLRRGEYAKGAEQFSDAIDGLLWTLQVLADLSKLHQGPSAIHDLSATGTRIVPELLAAWENEDYVMVADLLTFEFLPWLSQLSQVAELFVQQMTLERMKQSLSAPSE